MDLIPTKRHSQLLQDGFGHVVPLLKPEWPEVALVFRQVTGSKDPICEIEEAPVIRTATRQAHRVVGAVMPRRIQKFVKEPALQVGIGMIEQSRDACEYVVKDDDLVIDSEEQKGQGADRDCQENINRVEVGSAEHFQTIQAVVNGVVTPKERHLMSRTVVPVLREVDDQRDEQQLEQDVSMAGPNVEDGHVVVIAGRARQDADQEKNVQVVNRRRGHEVEDIGPACFADRAPVLLIGNVEFQRANQDEHEDVEAVRHDAQGKRPPSIDSPPKNSESEKQDRPIRKSTDDVADSVRLEAAPRSVHQLFAHLQSSTSQTLPASPGVGAQRIGRSDQRFTDSYHWGRGRFKPCPRVNADRSEIRALSKTQECRKLLWSRDRSGNELRGERTMRGIQS